jgi:hypothetical protein
MNGSPNQSHPFYSVLASAGGNKGGPGVAVLQPEHFLKTGRGSGRNLMKPASATTIPLVREGGHPSLA